MEVRGNYRLCGLMVNTSALDQTVLGSTQKILTNFTQYDNAIRALSDRIL